MKDTKIITEDKIVSSYKECKPIAKILFWVYLAVALVSLYGFLHNIIEYIAYIIMGVVGYLICIVSHDRQIVFNKESNSFWIFEKALGDDKYIIIEKIMLSDILKAEICEVGKSKKDVMYTLKLLLKNGEDIYPYNVASSDYGDFEEICAKINEYLIGDETVLVLKEKPMLFRIVGIVIFCFYLLSCCTYLFQAIQQNFI